MQEQPVRKQIDQNAAANRNKAAREIFVGVINGLIIRHPKGPIDAQVLARDAVALTKSAVRELMLEKML